MITEPRQRPLTERQLQILKLVAEGLNNWQIAEKIHIAEASVKDALAKIFIKLAVTNRTRAVAVAYESGLITSLLCPLGEVCSLLHGAFESDGEPAQ